MSTLDHNEPDDKKILGSHGPKEIDASAGYEQSDVQGHGHRCLPDLARHLRCGLRHRHAMESAKLINAHMNNEDGPNSKWTRDRGDPQARQPAFQP